MAGARTMPHRRPWFRLLVASVLLALFAYNGCTPANRYRWLSFFFDGVPDPSAVSVVGTDGVTAPAGRTVYYKHKPFADEDCKACHSSFEGMTIGRADRNVCFKCHKDVMDQFPVMHGPVATGECLWCHDPHETSVPHVLRRPPQQLCVTCHTRNVLLSAEVPAHQDEARNCLDCHYGHGSTEHGMLRPAADEKPPAPEEPAAPAQPEGQG